MSERVVHGDHLPEAVYDILPDCRIRSLIDGQAGGGVRIEQYTYPPRDACGLQPAFHHGGDVNELHGTFRAQCKVFGNHSYPQ